MMLCCFRLEHPPRGVLPADNQQTAEGGVPHVRHLGGRLAFHPQCLLSCHGAPGVIRCHARYVSSNYLNASDTFHLLSHLPHKHMKKTLTSMANCGRK